LILLPHLSPVICFTHKTPFLSDRKNDGLLMRLLSLAETPDQIVSTDSKAYTPE